MGKGSNRPPAGLLRPFVTLITHRDGLRHGLASFQWQDGSPQVGQVLEGDPLYSPPQIAFSEGDSDYCLGPRFPHSWPPLDVVSDRGPQFVSKFWTEFCRQLGATTSLSSGYHPQTNDQAERANQDLERVLCCVASAEPSSWSSRLTMVEYAHNSLPVLSTGLSPFQCCLGYQPPLFPSQESEAVVPSAHAFIQRCLRTWRIAKEALTRTGERKKASADRHRTKPPLYACGQKVWLSPRTLTSDFPHVNWDPNLLDRLLWPRCSVR